MDASEGAGRVVYRSPDALQNLRMKVTLTRVSGPRADKALAMEERLGSLRGQANPSTFWSRRSTSSSGGGGAAQGTTAAAAATSLGAAPSTATTQQDRPQGQAQGMPPAFHPQPHPGVQAPQTQQPRVQAPVAGGGIVPTTQQQQQQQQQAPRSSGGLPPLSSSQPQTAPPQQPAVFDPYGSYAPGASTAGGAVTENTVGATHPPAGPGPVTEGKGGAEALATVFESQARVHEGAERPLRFERVVAWQEKIFSAAEVDDLKRRPAETELDRRYADMIRSGGLTGETIYTYVDADPFADERDAAREVTTSPSEPFNGLFKAVFGTPAARHGARHATGKAGTRARTELARGRRRRGGQRPVTFTVCADCGPLQLPADHPAFHASPAGFDADREQVLMTIEAYPDGSIALCPDFTKEGAGVPNYRIERRDGSVYEYSIVNASTREETPLEKRDAAIAPTAALRRLQLLRRAAGGSFAPSPGPGPGALRLVVLGEIVAGRGFEHDHLYCEWVLDVDPLVWKLTGESAAAAGVTQISRTTTYPATGDGEGDGFFSADRLVAHWAMPFELELVAQEDPPPSQYPTVYFQVSSYDSWDRYRCEGYGHLQLGTVPLGWAEHRIKTWRAGGTVLDRVATHFIGGSVEIGDVTYAGTPRDVKGQHVHSRLGFVADASGEIKVRTNVMTQTKGALSGAAARGLGALRRTVLGPGSGGGATDRRGIDGGGTLKNVTDVVERARARLAEARAEGRLGADVTPRALILARAQQRGVQSERPAPVDDAFTSAVLSHAAGGDASTPPAGTAAGAGLASLAKPVTAGGPVERIDDDSRRNTPVSTRPADTAGAGLASLRSDGGASTSAGGGLLAEFASAASRVPTEADGVTAGVVGDQENSRPRNNAPGSALGTAETAKSQEDGEFGLDAEIR